MAKYETELPAVVWEFTEVSELLGVKALQDVMFVIGQLGGNPAGTPGLEQLAELREQYPQYGEMLR
jgi:hypothetical protein